MRAASDIERNLTATSTMQCIYSSVSKASLQKTFLLLKKEILRNADCLAGDAVVIAPVSKQIPC
jgi:hypothetical protein